MSLFSYCFVPFIAVFSWYVEYVVRLFSFRMVFFYLVAMVLSSAHVIIQLIQSINQRPGDENPSYDSRTACLVHKYMTCNYGCLENSILGKILHGFSAAAWTLTGYW